MKAAQAPANEGGRTSAFWGIPSARNGVYACSMGFSKICPECGTHEIKSLTPMTESGPAYLCENGHFFLEQLPAKLSLAARQLAKNAAHD